MSRKKLKLPSSGGEERPGFLLRPPRRPRGYALLGHGVDLEAGPTLAKALVEEGYAVLRWEPAGAADVLEVCEFLRREYAAPRLLVGHGRCAEALLGAVERVHECVAVALLGARPGAVAGGVGRRALLVLHSPADEVADPEAARGLFSRAGEPRSYVSLDDADHGLTRVGDARYAGRVLAAWASRYLPGARR